MKAGAMISVEDALAHCLALAAPLPAETVPLAQAAGRWMCAPAVAMRDQPPFPASAMDGYAVRAADLAVVPVSLTVVGESAAVSGPIPSANSVMRT